ncbi:MAG: LON peptidase substrate-binding domain-containing protein [Acidobacteria bacterium]|nr:LON peptidase substrate-binding domain-containing protein [Acidobacteriota bacterium]
MLEKLKQVQALPIFPLPVVLVPGMVMPLHIFEPRYRAMLQHCLETDNLFGLSYHAAAAVDAVTVPAAGSIGCGAQILTISRLADGRSDILTLGLDRYQVTSYQQEEPFLIARIEFFEDHDVSGHPADFAGLMSAVKALYERFSRAAAALGELPRPRIEPPEEPQAFSFAVALTTVGEPEQLQRLLEMRTTRQRLMELEGRLLGSVGRLEEGAAALNRVKGNGHRPYTRN